MSDGSLSQDEIDALLAGSGGLGFGGGDDEADALSDQEKQQFQRLFVPIAASQASNLSMLTGKRVELQLTGIEVSGRVGFLRHESEEVVEVHLDFKEGLSGDHLYILDPGTAIMIAGLMMGQDDIELNDAAISALQESLSQFFGPASTALGDKIGRTIMTDAPEGQFVPKAMARFPQGEFAAITYSLSIEGAGTAQIKEIYGIQTVREILQLSSGPAAAPGRTAANGPAAAPQAGYQNGFTAGAPQYAPQMQFGAQGFVQHPGMPGPSVQPVQFATLQQQAVPSEQGNIGLLMDVYMEMTVELGRTKKLIKEILGMGEGTIIELDKLAGEPVDILVNHKLIAKGEVVVIDENFGVRVTEIVSPMERAQDLI